MSENAADTEPGYDSRPDTHEHIAVVRGLLLGAVKELLDRAHRHDRSKLQEPERSVFDEATPKLRELEYGSDEYRSTLAHMQEALDHHYRHYRHHPEHHPNGIADMTLIDMLEMLVDWIAAGRRHASGGDPYASIEINAKRFGYGPEIERLLRNTVAALEAAEVPTD